MKLIYYNCFYASCYQHLEENSQAKQILNIYIENIYILFFIYNNVILYKFKSTIATHTHGYIKDSKIPRKLI